MSSKPSPPSAPGSGPGSHPYRGLRLGRRGFLRLFNQTRRLRTQQTLVSTIMIRRLETLCELVAERIVGVTVRSTLFLPQAGSAGAAGCKSGFDAGPRLGKGGGGITEGRSSTGIT